MRIAFASRRLLLLVLAAYGNSLWGSFQFDDFNVIVDNPAVHGLGAWWAHAGGIRTLLKLSYALNWSLGNGPLGFHLLNLLLHAANTLLVLQIGRYLPLPSDLELRRPWLALVAAGLFALHPVNTEAVTYVSGRSVSLMSLFYLGAVLAYLRGQRQDSPLLASLLAPVLFVLALLTKEVAISLPLLLLCLHKLGDEPGRRPRLWPFWLIALLALVGMLLHARYRELLGVSLLARGFAEQIAAQLAGLGYLLSRLWLPQRLNIDPDIAVPVWLSWRCAALALGLALWTAAAWRLRRSRPWLALGLIWPLVVLLPTNSVLPRLDVVSERQFYLAGVGLFWIIACGLAYLLLWFGPRQRLCMLSAVAGCLLAFTVFRNQDYRSETALWQAASRQSPNKARVFNNLGYAYQLDDDATSARLAYERALALDPDYRLARINLLKLPR